MRIEVIYVTIFLGSIPTQGWNYIRELNLRRPGWIVLNFFKLNNNVL